MKKTLTLVAVALFFITSCNAQARIKTTQTNSTVANRDIKVSTVWKTYTNSKYGFTFQYPANWKKIGIDAEVVERNGKLTAVEINFSDEVTQTTLLVTYHLPPAGLELYKYAESAKGAERIKIAGHKAVQVKSTMKTDGRGAALITTLRVMVVDVLDKKQTGEINIQFKTPVGNESEASNFKHLLSSFNFIN